MPRSLLIVALAATAAGCRASQPGGPCVYPHAPTSDAAERFHGDLVPDPYRPLEDPDSPESRRWIEEENRLTEGFLAGIPARGRIRERLNELWDFERYEPPIPRGGRLFYSRNDGLQNQSVLWVVDREGTEPRVLLDPNGLSEDGTVALTGVGLSDDGRLLAYSISRGGSDWQEWRVRDVETGKDLPDVLSWSKFSDASWSLDGKGFYYCRYDAPPAGQELQAANYYQKLCYHRLGTPQSEDPIVYERPDEKEWGFDGRVTEDGRWLVIHGWVGTDPRNRVFYRDLSDPAGKVRTLLGEFDAGYTFVGSDGPVLWFLTDRDAPRRRVIAVDVREPARERWREVIPQAPETLGQVSVVGDRFLASYLKDAHARVLRFGLDGAPLGELALPGIGSVHGLTGRRSDRESFYVYTSFDAPPTVYRLDPATGASVPFFRPRVRFDPSAFEVHQVFYEGKDGTRIPMFVSHRKGLRLDGSHPARLYGYGGFAIPMTPAFSVSQVVWMEMGGVAATACIRGGSEYGEDWHQAGAKRRKQNCFDDFIAAAEWLVARGYTSPRRLAILGGSNGGLLVGACMTQRPDLFGAAVPQVGVLDMLRFHKFTIGWAWTSDYGDPDVKEDYQVLRSYSPLHNLRPGTRYPATLITTADHDDRVVPAHSFKFAAALQAAQGGPAPVLIRIETKAGHGAGKPTAKLLDEAADVLAFLVRTLGVE